MLFRVVGFGVVLFVVCGVWCTICFLGWVVCGLFVSLFDFWFVVWCVWGLWLNFVLVYFG